MFFFFGSYIFPGTEKKTFMFVCLSKISETSDAIQEWFELESANGGNMKEYGEYRGHNNSNNNKLGIQCKFDAKYVGTE